MDGERRQSNRGRVIAVGLGLALAGMTIGAGWTCASLACMPRSVVEELHGPVSVADVSAHGMTLADGRFQGWGADEPVPLDLVAIPALTVHGIEVDPAGRAFGLIDVHHWCGIDPIRKHVARVDVGRVLEFLGGRATPGGHEALDFSGADGHFTPYGWNVSSWWSFEEWSGSDPARIY